jgi:hypothetical protein
LLRNGCTHPLSGHLLLFYNISHKLYYKYSAEQTNCCRYEIYYFTVGDRISTEVAIGKGNQTISSYQTKVRHHDSNGVSVWLAFLVEKIWNKRAKLSKSTKADEYIGKKVAGIRWVVSKGPGYSKWNEKDSDCLKSVSDNNWFPSSINFINWS